MVYVKPVSVVVQEGESLIIRSSLSPDQLISSPSSSSLNGESLTTLPALLASCIQRHRSKPAFGTREVLEVVNEDKKVKKVVDGIEREETKKWETYRLAEPTWTSYTEFGEIVDSVGKGLKEVVGKEKGYVNIFANTCLSWQVIAHSCASLSLPIVTAYATLGPAGLQHSITLPECVATFTQISLLPTLVGILPSCPSLKTIIIDSPVSEDELTAAKSSITSASPGIKVMTLAELQLLGQSSSTSLTESDRPSAEDTFCIMFTSGSMGPPKGVVIKHSNLSAALGGCEVLLGPHILPDDMYLGYLPLSHIIELMVELTYFWYGVPIGYGGVKTLTDLNMKDCPGDLRCYKPTILVGVPAVFEMIKKGLLARLAEAGIVLSTAFSTALFLKRWKVPVLGAVADKVIFGKLRERMGGRLRIGMSGGASLAETTQDWLTNVVVQVLQGYGSTECLMIAILTPPLYRTGIVGTTVPSLEMKIVSESELGYLITAPSPVGQLLVRGPSVTSSYFKDEKNTAEGWTEDGWFKTGDIARLNKDGTIEIVDRVKNLIKLSGGEYVAIESLESIYRSCPQIMSLCILAQSDYSQPIAVVVPHEANLRLLLGAKPTKSFEELCSELTTKVAILKSANAIGKAAGLSKMETLSDIILTPIEWLPETGLVSGAMKLQRGAIRERFKDGIATAFKGN